MKEKYYRAVILIVSILVFYNSIHNDLTTWDDQVYITKNQHIKDFSSENFHYIFTHNYASNYSPLHLVLYTLEYSIFKENPSGYHTVSILLHILVAVLVFSFLLSLLKNKHQAFFCTLLFAVHPYQSEVVAWASAQKDLLFMSFFLSAIISYLKFLDLKKTRYFILTCLFFLLSLFSKPTAICFPALIILIDLFQERKMNRMYWKRIFFLFIITFLFGLITLNAQKGAIAQQAYFNIVERFALAGHNLLQYSIGFIAPFNISAYYSYPEKINGHIPTYYWFSTLVIIVIILYLIFRVKKNSLLRFAIFWIIFSSALTLQIIPVGTAVRADRYMYLPSIGYAIIIVNYTYVLVKKYGAYFLSAFIIFLAIITIQLNKRWKDSLSLYNGIIDRDPKAWLILNNRGAIYMENKQYEMAEADFNLSIGANPYYYLPYSNLGNCYKEKGDLDISLKYYDQSLAIKSDAKTFVNRGVVFAMKKEYKFAIDDFDASIKIDHEYALAYRNRGIAKILNNNLEEGCSDLDFALKLGDEKSHSFIAKYCQTSQ